jgi:hypothetical protein
LGSIIDTVMGATESLATTKKLTFKTKVANGLPYGLGDEQRLTQVLLNLVGNSMLMDIQLPVLEATTRRGRSRRCPALQNVPDGNRSYAWRTSDPNAFAGPASPLLVTNRQAIIERTAQLRLPASSMVIPSTPARMTIPDVRDRRRGCR